jgi:hypothetical protein
MTIRMLLTVLGLSVTSLLVRAAGPTSILGVLEEIAGRYEGQSDFRGVRILFQKIGGEWQSFPSSCHDEVCLQAITSKYPRAVTWNIALSGRGLGQVTGQTPKAFATYADIGLQEIISKSLVPSVGQRSEEYRGFTQSSVLRPLIANSQPFFKDPDAWKPARVTAENLRALRLQFRRRFPKVSSCANQGDETGKPWAYRDADIKIVKAYSSSRGWMVAQVLLVGNRCLEPPNDGSFADAFENQWFVRSPRGQISFLGQGMVLVDAGDYDKDGRSELMFFKSGYNRDGYELFYDDFKRRVAFQFSYH